MKAERLAIKTFPPNAPMKNAGAPQFLWWVGLGVLCLLAYWPMFANGFVWDDVEFIVGNPAIRSLWPPGRFFTPQGRVTEGAIYPLTGQRPVMALSLALDYHLWKLNPFGYHLTNLLLHLLCVGGMAILTRQVARSRWAGFLAGALFAVHPGHAEGVIAFLGRSDLLATLFVLFATWAFLNHHGANGWRRVWWYLVSLASFVLACFSKESGLMLLGVLILCEALGAGLGGRWLRRILELLPFGGIALFYWLFRGWILGGQAAGTEWWGGSADKNIMIAFEAYTRYVRLLFFPLVLSPLHIVPVPKGWWDGRVLWGMTLFLGTLGGSLLAFRKNPRIGWWALWFLLGLLPVANLIPIPGMILAERWLYLPSVGACALAGWGLCVLAERARGWVRPAWIGLAALALALLAARTFHWNGAWKTEESVARTIVETSPDSWLGRNNLGNVLLNQKKVVEGEAQFREAIRIKPDYALAHSNLGTALRMQGRWEEAEAEYREALRYNPRYAEAHSNLGMVLGKKGELEGAVREFREAIPLKPSLAEIHYNLGLALGRLGKSREAEEALREAVRLKPDLADAYFNLGLALEAEGKTSDAVQAYRLYLRHSPEAEDRAIVKARVRSLEGGMDVGPDNR